MNQHQAVIQAMKDNGGYATLGHLYRTATKVEGSEWKTRTPFASIRRIVQQHPAFFRIRPGLWGLESERERIAQEFALANDAPRARVEEFNHSYYQGLIAELGNLENFETFIPHQDKNKLFLSRRLSEVASLPKFHDFTYEHILRRGRTIDVTWFNRRKLPNAFFEVEHSTDIQNSLLKFVEFQDFRVRMFIVADESRRREFTDKMGLNAFAPIRSEVTFLGYDSLSDLHSKVSARVAAGLSVNL
jgi:hypothetical protein